MSCLNSLLRIACAFLFLSNTGALATKSSPRQVAGICQSAASYISRESGVPLDVLMAISLTETGRKGRDGFLPWPWTVNMEGIGKWFEDYFAAQAYVDRHFSRGARSFDVGCFQINYKWHGHAFDSIEDMFDPVINARYAARFLGELYAEFGDWSKAAGAYHSRTPKYARRYSARFDRIRADLPKLDAIALALADTEVPTPRAQTELERNNYPLLQSNGLQSGASLVPLQTARAPLLEFGRARALVGNN